jgi:hypothetical protein
MTDASGALPPDTSGNIDLRLLFRLLVKRNRLILRTVVLGFVLAVLWLVVADPVYEARLVVAPKPALNREIRSGGLGQLSNLAALAGANVQSPGDDYFERYRYLLTSNQVADVVAADLPIMKRLYPRHWDERHQVWRPPDDALSTLKRGTKILLGFSPWHPPNGEDVHHLLQKAMTVSQDQKNSFITLLVHHKDRETVGLLAAKVHALADRMVRDQALALAQDRIKYLDQKIRNETVQDYRQLLVTLLGKEETSLMTLLADKEFSAETLDPVHVPRKPVSPKPIIVLALALALSLVIGVVVAVVLEITGYKMPGALDLWAHASRPLRIFAGHRHAPPRK